jgi:hypothetical protein
MPYISEAEIRSAGFVGFHTISNLRDTALAAVPEQRGVYLISHPTGRQPAFLARSTGGFFKRKDPTVSLDALREKWIESAPVIYVGKAGGTNSREGKELGSTLRSRLKLYFDFGSGKPVGHWGGRYIWQLQQSGDLVVCWLPTPNEEPLDVEQRLLDQSCSLFGGRLPFANLRR